MLLSWAAALAFVLASCCEDTFASPAVSAPHFPPLVASLVTGSSLGSGCVGGIELWLGAVGLDDGGATTCAFPVSWVETSDTDRIR